MPETDKWEIKKRKNFDPTSEDNTSNQNQWYINKKTPSKEIQPEEKPKNVLIPILSLLAVILIGAIILIIFELRKDNSGNASSNQESVEDKSKEETVATEEIWTEQSSSNNENNNNFSYPIGKLKIEGYLGSLEYQNGYVYALVEKGDFTEFIVIDVKNKEKPQIVGKCELSPIGAKSKFVVDENYTYIAGENLEIIDITDSTNPYVLEQFIPDGKNPECFDIEKKGKIITLLTAGNYLQLLDVSNIKNIEVAVKKKVSSYSYGEYIDIDEGYIYFTYDDAVTIYHPDGDGLTSIGSIDFKPKLNTLNVSGGYVFVSIGNGVLIADASQKKVVTEIKFTVEIEDGTKTEISEIYDIEDVYIYGNNLYISHERGFSLVSFNSPYDYNINDYVMTYNVLRICSDGKFAYINIYPNDEFWIVKLLEDNY